MTFGDGIRALRKAQARSVQSVAGKAHIPARTLCLIESGEHFPRLSELERLLDALGVCFREVCAAGQIAAVTKRKA